jgi:hypothetical protein
MATLLRLIVAGRFSNTAQQVEDGRSPFSFPFPCSSRGFGLRRRCAGNKLQLSMKFCVFAVIELNAMNVLLGIGALFFVSAIAVTVINKVRSPNQKGPRTWRALGAALLAIFLCIAIPALVAHLFGISEPQFMKAAAWQKAVSVFVLCIGIGVFQKVRG